jgi:OFA family oxalate/formate antiporter-like MFS transporter
MNPANLKEPSHRLYYGWVIVAACCIMLAVTYGLMYSYSVFFKPLMNQFGWDRSAVSSIYSASLIIRGGIAIAVGWLADRYGPRKLLVFCGFMIGIGLVLSSQVHTLWQLFLSYALVEAIGLSGAFGIGTAMVARWFTKGRGLALGIASTGAGLGTLLVVPTSERLIAATDWSRAFIISGIVASVIMVVTALLLKAVPSSVNNGAATSADGSTINRPLPALPRASFRQAIVDPRMLLLMSAFLFFFFGVQMIMVHLVNYATDAGVTPLVAATLVSIIGAVSIVGRIWMGINAERMGIQTTLVLTRVFLVVSFVWIIFANSLWAFYVFAVLFALPYGGEVPHIPLSVGKYFGTENMATLVGLNMFVLNIGGALGSWAAGKIFDSTHSYHWAFIAGGLSGFMSLIAILLLRKTNAKSENSLV